MHDLQPAALCLAHSTSLLLVSSLLGTPDDDDDDRAGPRVTTSTSRRRVAAIMTIVGRNDVGSATVREPAASQPQNFNAQNFE